MNELKERELECIRNAASDEGSWAAEAIAIALHRIANALEEMNYRRERRILVGEENSIDLTET